ncbi:vomeronasal type-1 receptor 4-like [Gracilinanus agilis]|uniref:vomeronasal type-1 receptor 4-like n=1 Tax=Gracilinanus agilis TaxID=191870 RepID=UPI001CFF3D2D|nr:vomeronasal type-1 receptor 4-like [Gracilinanus agilis]
MLTYNEILGILYLQLTGLGFIWNCILLFLNTINFLTDHRARPKKILIIHLSFSNAMLLLFRGIPTTTRLWRVKCFLNDLEIGIITYMQIISRGLSLSSTCLLSIFQAITISPNDSRWVELKIKAPKCIMPSILLCWVFYLHLDMIVFLQNTGLKNTTASEDGCNTGYRALDLGNKNHIKFIITECVHDIFFLCLMVCSSAYMVLILYRHKRHVNHIHSNSLSTKISPEARATQAILLLVGTFISFNVFSSFFILHVFYSKLAKDWMIHSSVLLSLGYPTISPFILISTGNQIPRTCIHQQVERLLKCTYIGKTSIGIETWNVSAGNGVP